MMFNNLDSNQNRHLFNDLGFFDDYPNLHENVKNLARGKQNSNLKPADINDKKKWTYNLETTCFKSLPFISLLMISTIFLRMAFTLNKQIFINYKLQISKYILLNLSVKKNINFESVVHLKWTIDMHHKSTLRPPVGCFHHFKIMFISIW